MRTIKHPAKYSDQLFPVFIEMLGTEGRLLDFMAGTCKICKLYDYGFKGSIHCAEIAEHWGQMGEGLVDEVWIGDSRDLPWQDDSFDLCCVSPDYGNRMSDHHDAGEDSPRNTYYHIYLQETGEKLTDLEGNASMHKWHVGPRGTSYRMLHFQLLLEASRVLKIGGRFVLNIKDHYVREILQQVTNWYLITMIKLGFVPLDWVKVPVTGNRQGANNEVRVDHENVILFELKEKVI